MKKQNMSNRGNKMVQNNYGQLNRQKVKGIFFKKINRQIAILGSF